MLRYYLQTRDISIYRLSKESGVPYSTVNDLANNKIAAGNCRASVIAKLAAALQISMEDLLAICEKPISVHTDHGSVDACIYARNKKYYVAFSYNGKVQELDICPVCRDAALFLQDFTEWTVDNFLAEQQLEVIVNELYYHAQK